MKIKNVFFLAAAVFFIIAGIASEAAAQTWDCGATPGTVTATLTGGTLTISGVGDMADFTSPPWFTDRSSITSVVIGDGVASIGNRAFYYCSKLASITIPDNVTSIGNYAFDNCTGLTSITIPDGVTSIGENAFSGCNGLTSITIPNSVNSIGNSAFYSCGGLTSITIPNGVASIGNAAFQSCGGLTSITIPNSVNSIGDYAFGGCSGLTSITIPDGVASIGENAFSGCSGLTSVIIPNSVNSIGNSAFSGCSGLTSVTIGNSVNSIGNNVFNYCNGLTSINVESDNAAYSSVDGVLFNKDKTELIQCPVGKQDVSYTIPNSVTSIRESAFNECSGLTSVIIPNSVVSIGNYAFIRCGGLTSVTIGNSVTSIGNGAFYNCGKLTSVISLRDTPLTISNDVFYGIGADACLYVPPASTGAYGTATWWKDFSSIKAYAEWNCGATTNPNGAASVKATLMGSTLTISGSGAMGNFGLRSSPWYSSARTTITKVVIENGVTTIGNYLFEDCINLTSIIIPDDVTSIGNYAFSGCGALLSLTVSKSVTYIGSNAFRDCGLINVDSDNASYSSENGILFNKDKTKLIRYPNVEQNAYSIPGSVTSIESYAFYYCSNLTSVTIPNSVNSIESYAFFYCSNLTSVTIPDGVTSIGEGAFNGCAKLTSVTIPDGVISIGERAFFNCRGLTSITIPNSLTSIGNEAFRDCNGLISVIIPNSVTSIGRQAFYSCINLTSITIGNSVASIEFAAFANCDKLTTVISLNDTPPIIDDPFYNMNKTNICIYVSKNSTDDYKNEWGFTCVKSAYNTVTFNSQGGSAVTEQEVFNGSKAVKPADPTRTGSGYRFMGWYTEADCVNPWNFDTGVVTGDITLYAKWVQEWDCGAIAGTVTAILDRGTLTISGAGKMADYTISSRPPWYNDFREFITNVVIEYGVTSIGNYAFQSCTGLTSITIGNNVASIGNYAFQSCTGLTSLTILDGVTSIANYAFNGCSGLTSLAIPNSVTSIGSNAFAACTGLTSITIPNSVTSIGMSAFSGCGNLASVIIPNSVTSIGDNAFTGCTNMTSIDVESGNTNFSSEGGVLFNKDKTTLILCPKGKQGVYTIPIGVTSIGQEAFRDCIGLTSVTIPGGVISIGNYAFYNCGGLTSVTIPNSVASIGNYAFYNCGSLTSVSIPDGVTSIGQETFRGCGGLASITIPNSVTSIGNNAFQDCGGLTSVTIGSSVTSIGNIAFYNCTSLTSIISLNAAPPTIGTNAFNGVTACLYVPKSNIENYKSASAWSIFSSCINSAFYTVTFDLQHGSAVTEQDVLMGGSKAEKPADPALADHTFDGWYKETGCVNPYYFDTDVTGGITLYAKWTITAAAITVTAPLTGAAPDKTASGAGNFTISTVTWSPDNNSFLGNTQYGAQVTLTANPGFTFKGIAAADVTINGAAVDIVNNNDNTLTILYTFPKTENKQITQIDITRQPELNYTHGGQLDLSNLLVKITYSDLTFDDGVAYDKLADKNISAAIAHGSILSRTVHDGKSIMLTRVGTGISAKTGMLTVGKRPVTVTAEAKGKVYGGADPALTYKLSENLIDGDKFTGELSRKSGEDAGGYAIEQNTLSAGDNYDIKFETANFTITQKHITVTVTPGQTKVYGEKDPAAFAYTVTPALIGGDKFTGVLSRKSGENVGSYAISGSLSNNNYEITFQAADFNITQALYKPSAPAAADSYAYGTALSAWDLSADVNGVWEWQNGTIIPSTINNGYTAVFTLTNANYYLSGGGEAGNVAVTVRKIAQAALAITGANPAKTYTFGDASFKISTKGGTTGGAVTYTVVSGAADVTSNGLVTITGAGNIVINACLAGDAVYEEVFAEIVITVNKAVLGKPDTSGTYVDTSVISSGVPGISVEISDDGGICYRRDTSKNWEYSVDGVNWIDDLDFGSLPSNSEYAVFIRTKETENFLSSEPQEIRFRTITALSVKDMNRKLPAGGFAAEGVGKTSEIRYGVFIDKRVVSGSAGFYVVTPNKVNAAIIIYDNLGNAVFKAQNVKSGEPVSWNLNNKSGRSAGSGSYLVKALARDANGKIHRYSEMIHVRR